MRKYTVVAVLGFQPGAILGLSEKQAELRKHALKPLGKGAYEVLSRVEFKIGEEISTDDELNKALATSLEPEQATKQKVRDKARAEADAKDLAELKGKAKAWDDVQEDLAALRFLAEVCGALSDAAKHELADKAAAMKAAADEAAKGAKK